jgi:hypothetical protein
MTYSRDGGEVAAVLLDHHIRLLTILGASLAA